MLPYDPIPWLISQEGLPALRARRLLGLRRNGDGETVQATASELSTDQDTDGSFEGSLLKTAGVLNLLDDLGIGACNEVISRGASYLIAVLRAQAGYERAKELKPGSLRAPCDLCGFFGPYHERAQPEVVAWGAREMNHYRHYEPLLGPKSPVRSVRRSSRDRVGPPSCYLWGLIPLAYAVEALSRAGYGDEKRIKPAINALLGAQREGGGWCRNLGGHPNCTLYAIRALAAHPQLGESEYAERAIRFLRGQRRKPNSYAMLQALARLKLSIAHDLIRKTLSVLVPRQRPNGTFGRPNRVERVAAVTLAARAVGWAPG